MRAEPALAGGVPPARSRTKPGSASNIPPGRPSCAVFQGLKLPLIDESAFQKKLAPSGPEPA